MASIEDGDVTGAGWLPGEVIATGTPAGRGAVAGVATEDLNANVVAWPPGGGVDEHVNAAVDVLIFVIAGALTLTLAGAPHVLDAGDAIVVPKGARRAVVAGSDGVRYLTCHRIRPPLQIG